MRTWALGPTIAQIATSLVESLYLVGLVLTRLHLQLRTWAHGPTIAHIRWRALLLGKAAQKVYLPRAWVFATMLQRAAHCFVHPDQRLLRTRQREIRKLRAKMAALEAAARG